MKTLRLATFLLAAISSQAVAAVAISEAAAHVGETTVVRGMVVQVSTVGSGMKFLNFGKPHPNSEFTAVVRPGTEGFENLADFQDKEVEVEGVIELHKGRPQIVLTSPENLRVAGAETPVAVNMTAPLEPISPPDPATPSRSAPKVESQDDSGEQASATRAGALVEFKVPLNDEEKRLAGRSPAGGSPGEATVGIMLPEMVRRWIEVMSLRRGGLQPVLRSLCLRVAGGSPATPKCQARKSTGSSRVQVAASGKLKE
jgi:hypothetical protein